MAEENNFSYREDRLRCLCDGAAVEKELHFLSQCQNHKHIREEFSQKFEKEEKMSLIWQKTTKKECAELPAKWENNRENIFLFAAITFFYLFLYWCFMIYNETGCTVYVMLYTVCVYAFFCLVHLILYQCNSIN